jgi:hypothetical protein
MTKLEELKKFIEEKQPTYYGVRARSRYRYENNTEDVTHTLVKVNLKRLTVKNEYPFSSGSGVIQPWANTFHEDSHPNTWCFDAREREDGNIYLDFTADDYGRETVLFVKVSEDFKKLYSYEIVTLSNLDGMVLILDEYETVDR